MNEIDAFTANLRLLDPGENAVDWNLNQGLQDLAQRLADLQREVKHIRALIEATPPR